ncbi:unnamed protein product [Symbiodinium microadriaticum]|nr:unnamed protein product [Symbiodinium microadriaticum]
MDQAFGEAALPEHLQSSPGNAGAASLTSRALQINGSEATGAVVGVWQQRQSPAETQIGRAVPDPSICGKLGTVPDLPNPFTVTTDCPVLVAEMLKNIPPEDWDAKRFVEPVPITGLPNLYHGPGGLLSPHTPRQLANNQLAAAIANRLCENLRISLARACQDYALKQVPQTFDCSESLELERSKILTADSTMVARFPGDLCTTPTARSRCL